MANTIKIKRSTSTATPTSLSEGELAYSESSSKLFIGTSGSNIETIGGELGTSVQAYDANIVSDASYVSTDNNFTTTLKSKLDGVASSANNYALPTATSSVLGGVKVGTNLSIASGVLSASDTTYSLPTASSSTLGGVKIGSNLSISGTGVLSATDTDTTYSNATTSAAGLMSTTDKSKLDGVAASANNYSLTTASSSVLGGIKVGTNLSIASGVLSATDTNTTYSDATTSASGLMSSTDKTNHNSVYSWYSTMTTADGDSIINTVNEIVSAFESHAEGLNLITELDAKLTAASTIDGGSF